MSVSTTFSGQLLGLINYTTDYGVKDPNLTTPEQKRPIYNSYIKTLSKGLQGTMKELLAPTCPLSIRALIVAQHHDKVVKLDCPDGQSVRTANLFHAIIGFSITLTARIVRTSFRTLFSPVSLAVAAYQQNCYSPHLDKTKADHIVVADLKSIGYEWLDLGITCAVPLIGLVNTLAPQAIPMSGIRDHYIKRVEYIRAQTAAFNAARTEYDNNQEKIHEQWNEDQTL